MPLPVTKSQFRNIVRTRKQYALEHPLAMLSEGDKSVASIFDVSERTVRSIRTANTWQKFVATKDSRNDKRAAILNTQAEITEAGYGNGVNIKRVVTKKSVKKYADKGQKQISDYMNAPVKRSELVIRDSRISKLFNLYNKALQEVQADRKLSVIFLVVGCLMFIAGIILLLFALSKIV